MFGYMQNFAQENPTTMSYITRRQTQAMWNQTISAKEKGYNKKAKKLIPLSDQANMNVFNPTTRRWDS